MNLGWKGLAAAALLLTLAPAAAYEKRFNAGGGTVPGPGGKTYEADVAYDGTANHAGYVGGSAASHGNPVVRWRGAQDPYLTVRSSDPGQPLGYRFDVPNGAYLVLLGFYETWNHGPGRRVFDVRIEGTTVVPSMDILRATDGMWRVIEYRFRAQVTDGRLDVDLVPLPGSPDQSPSLSAIEVVDAAGAAVSGAPAAPANVRAISSFGAVDVAWDQGPETDVLGYRVYRGPSAAGPWTLVNPRLQVTSPYDDLLVPEGTWFYKVNAVDADGLESPDGAPAQATCWAPNASTLPLFQLQMDAAQLLALNADPQSDTYYPAQVEYAGVPVDGAEARYRGQIARTFPKKNWKVKLPGGQEIDGRDTFNLNADMWDAYLVRKALSFDLYRDQGIITPDAEPALLTVNGELVGVVQDLEEVDGRFLARRGLPADAEVFKANWDQGNLTKLADPALYRTYYSQENGTAFGYDRLQDFIERLNDSADTDHANTIAEYVNLPEWVKYHATLNFVGEDDSYVHNYFLYYDAADPRWRFIPYDHDRSFGNQPWDPLGNNFGHNIAEGEQAHQGIGWNKLITDVLAVKQFRKRFTDTLRRETTSGLFSVADLGPRIDARVALVQPDGFRDTNKWPLEDNAALTVAATQLRDYVFQRKDNLEWQMEVGAGGTGGAWEYPEDFRIYVNEFMPVNAHTIADGAGQYDPWIELYNYYDQPANVGGMYLSDSTSTPLKWALPAGTTIPAHGFLVVWADNQPAQGALHANFTLGAAGGTIVLTARPFNGVNLTVQKVTYAALGADVSQGMLEDGLYRWRQFTTATPGATNANGAANQAPVITDVFRNPPYPQAAQPVVVTARVTDDHGVAAVQLSYHGKVAIWQNLTMLDDGLHGDGAAGDGVYGATLPGDALNTVVSYYVKATDASAQSSVNPKGAPSIVYRYTIGTLPPKLVVNELMADNTRTIADEMGEYDDWVEIYNADTRTFDLGGMYLTDDPAVRNKWKFPAGSTLAPGARVLVWCDNDVEQGRYHTNFKLAGAGDDVWLFDVDATGRAAIDGVTFGALAPDWSFGRWPDGSTNWVAFYNATPNAANQAPDAPPAITQTANTPAAPTQLDTVTVTARITDDHALIRRELFVDTGAGFVARTMYDDGLHGDGAASDGVFGATIAPQPQGTIVKYYVEAEDDTHNVARDPAGAPAAFHSYGIGYRVPPLFINEFLADNIAGITDEYGQHDDWIEIYNAGAASIDMGGMYMTDDLNVPNRWPVPAGTVIGPHEYLLFWADTTPSQGPRHTNFSLKKAGEHVGLFDTDANGQQRIDGYIFGAQTSDVSMGRSPDGGATWQVFAATTPGGPNTGAAPVSGVAAVAYNTVVDVTWTAHPAANVTGYDVFGAASAGGPFAKLNAAPVTGWTLFRETGLPNAVARFYKVRALFADGTVSRDSVTVSATPQAGAVTPVTDLRVSLSGNDVVLRWTAPTGSPALVHVDVFRDGHALLDADVDAGLHLYGSAPVAGPFTDVNERSSGAVRFYVVRPVDANGARATE